MLTGHKPCVAEELRSLLEPSQVAGLDEHRQGCQLLDAVQAHKRSDLLLHQLGQLGQQRGHRRVQPCHPLALVIKLRQVLAQHQPPRGLLEVNRVQPLAVWLAPGLDRLGGAETGSEQEFAEPVLGPLEVHLDVLALAHKVAHGLEGLVGDIDGSELPGAQQARELEGVLSVGLDTVARLLRN